LKPVRDDGKKIKNNLESLDTQIRPVSIMLISIPSAEMPSDSLTPFGDRRSQALTALNGCKNQHIVPS